MNVRNTSLFKKFKLIRVCKTLGYIFAILGLVLMLITIKPFRPNIFGMYLLFFFVGAGYLALFYLGKQSIYKDMKEESVEYQSRLDLEITKYDESYSSVCTKAISYVFLTVCALLAFMPFYWMIISSVKTEIDFRETVGFATFWPREFQFANYKVVVSSLEGVGAANTSFIQMITNTLVVGITSTVLGVIVCIITAYALARMNFKGKEILFTLMLGTMMIPGELFTLTNYITTVAKFNWADTYTIMILPFLVSIYYIYLLRNNFMQIPNSLYQAAKVDGLSDAGYLIKVMIPLTAPTLISVTLLKFIGTWNSYIWPRLVNSPAWQLVTNWVDRGFMDSEGVLNGGRIFNNSYSTLKMAAVCMVSLPLFILFTCFRKYIMKGVSKSGTKG